MGEGKSRDSPDVLFGTTASRTCTTASVVLTPFALKNPTQIAMRIQITRFKKCLGVHTRKQNNARYSLARDAVPGFCIAAVPPPAGLNSVIARGTLCAFAVTAFW